MQRSFARALWCAVLLLAPVARADTPPQVAPGTVLLVLDVGGITSVNLRAKPDPRSPALDQIRTGTSDIQATGAVATYGDTYWVEVRSGAQTGWLNARLTATLPSRTPLQAYVSIDALQPIHGFDFKATPYREATATSYEECARRCASDVQCVAVAYSQASEGQSCRQFAVWPDLAARGNSDVAAKPQPAPEGGWSASQTAAFDRIDGQTLASEAMRVRVAHSASQCAAQCSVDASCAAYSFQRKLLICRHFDAASTHIARNDTELGIRQRTASAAVPGVEPRPISSEPDLTVSIPPPRQPTGSEPQSQAIEGDTAPSSRSAAPVAPPTTALATATLVRDLLARATPVDGWMPVDIASTGRIAVRHSTEALVSRASAPAAGTTTPPGSASPEHTVLAGDVNNLAPLLPSDRPEHVHLAYYPGPTLPPVILATKRFDTEAEAIAESLRMQRNLDEIAKLANLGVDRFALLKPMRR